MRRVLVALGNPLRRDDGVGLKVAELLQDSAWEVIPAGSSPENVASLVARHRPDVLVVVDAAEMGLPPGEVRVLPHEEAPMMTGSTHALPLSFFLELWRGQAGEVVLIGIQPADRGIGEGLTPEAEAAAQRVAEALSQDRWRQLPAHRRS